MGALGLDLPDGSVDPGQMTSFDHYALGGVADWPQLAALEPGYRVAHISPTLLDDLDDASAWRETPYGPARAGALPRGDPAGHAGRGGAAVRCAVRGRQRGPHRGRGASVPYRSAPARTWAAASP
ncbi:hypothetical protein PV682_30830 [Streptomyces niveiscabiei]|uniref:hypothetical protein n=1 Tax=Streptomyces niveiscabiei TaxID=164115 RepID=UPI0029B68A74|nr:hypothetical protein [Streptomyces niveiscabiei]MDX3385821.1 hypothetical protein [Streptomyces niveiscabiei]